MEALTLEGIYFIGQTIAAVAIVISLIYVGRQVKQNTEATQIGASQAFVQMFNTITNNIGSTASDIWLRGVRDFDGLNEHEKVRFSTSAAQLVRVFESAYYQWRRGALDNDIWSGFSRAQLDILNEPGMKQWWSIRKRWHGDQFQTWIDGCLESEAAEPMYPFVK